MPPKPEVSRFARQIRQVLSRLDPPDDGHELVVLTDEDDVWAACRQAAERTGNPLPDGMAVNPIRVVRRLLAGDAVALARRDRAGWLQVLFLRRVGTDTVENTYRVGRSALRFREHLEVLFEAGIREVQFTVMPRHASDRFRALATGQGYAIRERGDGGFDASVRLMTRPLRSGPDPRGGGDQ